MSKEYEKRLLELASDLKHFIEEQGIDFTNLFSGDEAPTKPRLITLEPESTLLLKVIYLLGFIFAIDLMDKT